MRVSARPGRHEEITGALFSSFDATSTTWSSSTRKSTKSSCPVGMPAAAAKLLRPPSSATSVAWPLSCASPSKAPGSELPLRRAKG